MTEFAVISVSWAWTATLLGAVGGGTVLLAAWRNAGRFFK